MASHTLQQMAKMIRPGQLGTTENNIFLYCPSDFFDPRIAALVSDSNWSHVRGCDVLTAPATLENYYALERFSLEFSPTAKFLHWQQRTKAMPSALALPSNAPLFDYQREGASFLVSRDRAMLSLSPGLGKTLTSAYAAGVRDFKQVLCVCPASLLFYWRGELEKWAERLPLQPFVTILHRDKAYSNADNFPDATQHWLITNPETIVRRLEAIKLHAQNMPFECLIVDESIMYKHRNSQRSKAMKDLAKIIPTVWFLTGAPATRYLDDMWHQFHILKPTSYPSYWRFARQYCVIHDDEWGSKVVANARSAEKEIKKNFQDIYF